LWIGGASFQEIVVYLANESFIHHLHFKVYKFNELEINNANINSLTFDTIIKSDSAIYLQNFNLNQLEFTENFKNEGTFSISQVKATNTIHHSDNDKAPINLPSQLSFYKSDMGTAIFLDTLFDSFDKIVLHRSKLNNISTSHGHFPLKTKHPHKIFSDKVEEENEPVQYLTDNTELAETYNHLQLAMQKQGNRTWAFKYYAEYMEWYRREQKEKKNCAQFITLSLNKISTNYGASWIRSFLLTLALGLIFFFAYIMFLPDIKVGFDYLTWPHIKESIAYFSRYYFDFIIPTHKIDFIKEYDAGFWSALIDIVSRIFVGYLIYQTIAAFRQFGKR